jgi:hypothetical protein
LADPVEICLDLSGEKGLALRKIVRVGHPAHAEDVAPPGLLDAARLAGERRLSEFAQHDPALVASGRTLFATASPNGLVREWRNLRNDQRDKLRTYICTGAFDDLPWEAMTDGVASLLTEAPLMRCPVPIPPRDLVEPTWPIRIFVVNARNPGTDDISADEEVWHIRRALRSAEHSFDLEVYDVVNNPGFAPNHLMEAMRKWPGGPHVLHFIGHSSNGPDPALRYCVCDEERVTYGAWTRGQIAGMLTELPELRLVYVNACRSHSEGVDPAAPSSIAQTFLKRAAAVIAMQADVSGEAAAVCAGKFYMRLAEGASVDFALLSARLALLGKYSEQHRDLYTPVLTTRVAAQDILPMRDFKWTAAQHHTWQNALRENWAHFVNQHPHRRELYEMLFEPKSGQSGLAVRGDEAVGKSWLVKWSAYAIAMNGLKVHYLAADKEADWLELLRRLRDGTGTLITPGLDPLQRNEFNWKLQHLVQNQPAPLYSGQPVTDTFGRHTDIIKGRVIDGFEAATCEAMVYALQQEARVAPQVVVLDNPPRSMLTAIKKPLLDALVDPSNKRAIRVILCSRTERWKSYEEQQSLDFAAWRQVVVSNIDARHTSYLIRELIRLQFPNCETTASAKLAKLDQIIIGLKPGPMSAGVLYNLAKGLGIAEGLHG